ncbi:GNAT family N-acetyltransferase [Paenibacillus sp. GYB003]|uniref:GNAT family N-acetyltransferase n=1 Tax=Paenibacillus sp. GYB003 TaxID=2994392 RepID=UPI002F9641F7
MGNELRLVRPSAEYRDAYLSFYNEWLGSGEKMVPWVIARDPSDFAAMLDYLFSQDSEEKLDDPNWVPHSTYWLIDGRNEVAGVTNIRHRLNRKLLNSGGHIGYGIRPSARRKGYATALLALALQKARELGISDVLVCCDRNNVGSEKTILKNGGVFESEYTEEDGGAVKRFWIGP